MVSQATLPAIDQQPNLWTKLPLEDDDRYTSRLPQAVSGPLAPPRLIGKSTLPDEPSRYQLYDGPAPYPQLMQESRSMQYEDPWPQPLGVGSSDERRPVQLEDPFVERSTTLTPMKSLSSVRKPTSQSGSAIRARSISSRMHGDKNAEENDMPSEHLPSQAALPRRSSTVRFVDRSPEEKGGSSAASFILSYPSEPTPAMQHPTGFHSGSPQSANVRRSQTNVSRKKSTLSRPDSSSVQQHSAEEMNDHNVRRYKSMNSAASSRATGEHLSRQPTHSRASVVSRTKSHSASDKSRRSRVPVNFGSDNDSSEDEIEGAREASHLPTVDSRILARSKTARKKTLSGPSSGDATGQGVPELSSGGSTSASTSSADEKAETASAFEENACDDVTSEIDSVLLSVIARSNTSKSYARPVGGFASALNTPKEVSRGLSRLGESPSYTSSPGTPMGRRRTWREVNGKWTKEDVEDESLMGTPTYTKLNSIGDAQGNLRPSRDNAQSSDDVMFMSPQRLSHQVIAQARQRARSMHEHASDREQQTSPSSSPKRRAALAKREANGSSPRRYKAALAGDAGETMSEMDMDGSELDASQSGYDSYSSVSAPAASSHSHLRLHTGKSIRTPADKRRERQYAMDRVQSIVNKAQAARTIPDA